MNNITWAASYEIYRSTNSEIDSQHKKLFEILQQLQLKSFSITTAEEIEEIIKDLNKYDKEHFAYEEKIMLEKEYPKYNEHKEEHESFMKDINKIIERSRKMSFMFINVLIDFIKSWLILHILGTDRELADYLKMMNK